MKTFEHGGNIHKVRRALYSTGSSPIDFSANINPLGPPEWVRPLISSQLEGLIHYPDPENTVFVNAVATYAAVDRDLVVVGNGTTELLYTAMRIVPCRRVLIPVPSYVDYTKAALLAGKKIETFSIREDDDFKIDIEKLSEKIRPDDLVVLGSPNNPTGMAVDRSQLVHLVNDFPESMFLIDEAFLDFLDTNDSVAGIAENVITLNSMTKFYGLPGLRVGYGIFPRFLADEMHHNLPPWTVNSLAQVVGARCLEDTQYQLLSRKTCRRLRQDLVADIRAIGQLKIYEGETNYLFIKILNEESSSLLAQHCLENGIMIRRCDNYQGLDSPSFIRVAVRTELENRRLVEVLSVHFQPRKRASKIRKKTPSIMFQGTCSDAGKSILTAALCRILWQDGVRVAPFKAQNMSLNSFVTLHGHEMGRAQVVQAQAARVDPDYRMNPILLKPNSDTGSQVILNGKAIGNMSVFQYNSFKPNAWDSVCKTYDSLADEYDVIVLEGAGSPGEVNLKADDIVNMKMARYAEAPVLLVGDIDRGGVYASFIGTMEVLGQWERELVKGYIVNKFRGQAELLDAAHSYLKLHTARDVFGVIPFLPDLGLPEEDSVSFKKGSFNRTRQGENVEIVVVNLPHISNFTDLEPFLNEPDVSLRVVANPEDIGKPDAIILPGSKNVIHDLKFLKTGGFAEKIQINATAGCEIVGICGGYQMLGRTIRDPYEIESSEGSIEALSYLEMETTIEKDKNLTRKSGLHLLSGKEVVGYEIHHGISTISSRPVMRFEDGSCCGLQDRSEKIWGCYLHGVFDCDDFRRWFIDRLRQKAGLSPIEKIVAPYDLDNAFNRLASCVREAVDIKRIYRMLRI